MSELVWVHFQTGTCTRCGKQVTRRGPKKRWHDQFGRDRCRASWEDDQCDVAVVHDEERLAKLVTTEITTVTLGGADGRVRLVQDLPAGMDWSQDLIPPMTEVTWITVTRRQTKYHAQYVPGEGAGWRS